MTIYRLLLCGQPIKRIEYLKRSAFTIVTILAMIFLSSFAQAQDSGVIDLLFVSSVLFAFITALLSVFWTYWRIRDCLNGRNKAALAFLVGYVIPLGMFVWYFWPSRAIPLEDE